MSSSNPSVMKAATDYLKAAQQAQDAARHRYWEPPAIPMDNKSYDRLREMKVCRVARWDTDTVTMYLKHTRSGLESRKVEVDKAIMVNDHVVMARIINQLSAELETEVEVYAKLESDR